jgi:hypothetical protein
MINKISLAPSSPTRSQKWTVSGPPSQNTSSTGTQAWGVKSPNDVPPEAQSNKSQLVKEAPKSMLNPLSYGTLGSHWNSALNTQPLPFQAPKLDTPQAVDTWNTIQATTFMPVPPSIGGGPLNTTQVSNPLNTPANTLGSNLFTQSLDKLFG